jgi:hypothetical protein
MTEEENKIECDRQVKEFFAKKPPPPKEIIPGEVQEHFREHFVNRPLAYVEHMPTDYDRQIKKACEQRSRPSPRKKSGSTATTGGTKSGKTFPQLRQQPKQSISPLKASNDKFTDVAGDQIDLEEFGRAGFTVGQILGTEEIPGFVAAELARKYVTGKPLVTPEQYRELPTQMRQLHDWYLREAKQGETLVMVKVTGEHYVNACGIYVEFSDLFELFHMDSINKSLISCYCL